MEQFKVALEIGRVAALWFGVWIVSGLWVEVFLLRGLMQPAVRWPLIAIGGMATHMIFVLNLSYMGVSVRHGWYWALAATLVPLLFRPKQTVELLRTYRSGWVVLLFVSLGVSTQSWSLVKEGVLTTSPAENGDWLTYVTHADILADHGYGYSAARTEYPQHFLYTEYYESSSFRYGPSHLLASSSVIAGQRAVFIFNVFCGCLIGLAGCSLTVFASQLRLGERPAFWLGLLWSVHPSVNWVGLAAFMPQLVGVSMMLSLMALCPLLVGRRSLVAPGALMGLLLCALFVGYNELLPITGAAIGLYLITVVRNNPIRWKRLLCGASVMIGTAILLSPVGIYRGVLGMLLQIQLARRTGGAEQAVDHLVYFLGSWLGVLPLPPTKDYVAQYANHSWHLLAHSTSIFCLSAAAFLLFLGVRQSGKGRRVILPITVTIGLALAVYIQVSFESPQFRTWGQFKLTQYLLPFAGLLMYLGASGSADRLRKITMPLAAVLTAVVFAQGVHYYSRFPKTSLRVNQPRYGMYITRTDMDFVDALNRIVPPGQPVLSVNDIALARNVTTSLLLYPRRVLAPGTPISEVFSLGTPIAVDDRNYQKVRNLTGTVLWENERFSISKLAADQVYLSLADAPAKILGPQSELALPGCKTGDRVAIHGFAPEGGDVTAVIGQGGAPKLETFHLRAGEFIFQVATNCEKGGSRAVLKTAARIFVSDYELVRDEQRSRQLVAAADELVTQSGPLMNLLPLLGKSNAWQTRQFDGSRTPPTIEFDANGVKLTSVIATSGGLETVLNLPAGWYELEATATIPSALTGTGRGFGIGFLDLPESQSWQRTAGRFNVRRLIQIPKSGPRGFGLVLGGYGTVVGQTVVTRLELKPAGHWVNSTGSSPVHLAPWGDAAWALVSYDGAKDLSERSLSGSALSLTSAKPTSSGVGMVVDLRPGTYLLGARIEASVPSSGPGLGYAVLLEGHPDSIINLKVAGVEIGQSMFSITKGGKFRLVTLVGGYGFSQGAAQFSDLSLRRVSDAVSPARSAKAEFVQLPGIDTDGWRVVTLDPSPGAVNVRKGAGWIGLGSSGQISSAAVTGISLEKGTYVLGADIVAEESADGSGRGYGIGFLQNQQFQWWVREIGSHRITALVMPEHRIEDSMALIVGGFGTVKGSARFTRPVIRAFHFPTLAAVE